MGLNDVKTFVCQLLDVKVSEQDIFKVIECVIKEVLFDIIKDYIMTKSIVISDYWKAYDGSDKGFTHLRVNRSIKFKDPENGAHTNSTEGAWSAIK